MNHKTSSFRTSPICCGATKNFTVLLSSASGVRLTRSMKALCACSYVVMTSCSVAGPARNAAGRHHDVRAGAQGFHRAGQADARGRAQQDGEVLRRAAADGGRAEAGRLVVHVDGPGPSPRADVRVPADGGRQGALDLRPLRGRALDVIGRRPEPRSATKRRSRFAGLRPTPISDLVVRTG